MKTDNYIAAIKLTIKAEMQNYLQAAINNDGKIDKQEEKKIKKLKRISNKYIRAIERIK